MKKLITRLVFITIFISTLSSCGGGGGDGGNGGGGGNSGTGKFLYMQQSFQRNVIGATYTTSTEETKRTTSAGEFDYAEGDTITFQIAGKSYTVAAKSTILISELANNDSGLAAKLKTLLLNLDNNKDASDGINIEAATATVDPALSDGEFAKQLYQATGTIPVPTFSPSLGINLESAQAEADTAGQAMPFVDIFRTARPFKELSPSGTTFDANGWPTSVPGGGRARTKLLQGTTAGMLPSGEYTLIYEGGGTLEVGGAVATVLGSISGLPAGIRGLRLRLDFADTTDTERNALGILVSGVSTGSYIKNIRIIMPGGTCRNSSGAYNNYVRVNNASECPTGTEYISFEQRLIGDRNSMIFNPEYLAFLKDFKVIRMMNFMDASPGITHCRNGLLIDDACVLNGYSWAERATLNNAVWGGSARTDITERRGVPVEVLVELANQTGASPWFTMSHFADDDFNQQFATYVAARLAPHLKVYLEYSNEIWNSGFIAFHYMEKKGVSEGLNTKPAQFTNDTSRDEAYFARLRYYSKTAVRMFDVWGAVLAASPHQLIRVMGTSQGDTVLSEQVLQYQNAAASGKVDALAMAPYFFGCVERTGSCFSAPKVLSELSSVNDIFDIIDQPFNLDPQGMAGVIEKISRQANVAVANGVKLLAYEGGQHLTIMGSMGNFDAAKKQQYRSFFQAANRDARMKQRYTTLLDAWKAQSGNRAELFNLYTLPQTYYEFGNWGLKEHLGKNRNESPKYDASMDFQERTGINWWGG